MGLVDISWGNERIKSRVTGKCMERSRSSRRGESVRSLDRCAVISRTSTKDLVIAGRICKRTRSESR